MKFLPLMLGAMAIASAQSESKAVVINLDTAKWTHGKGDPAESESALVGQDAATASTEYLVAPGDNKTITVNLKPNVSAIGVAVLYRDIDRAAWRADAPAAANGPTKLTATVGKLALIP